MVRFRSWGGERYELAADEESGEVRVYALDKAGSVAAVQLEKVRLLIGGPESSVVELVSRKNASVSGGTEAAGGETADDDAEEKPNKAEAEGDDKPHFAGLLNKQAIGRKITLLIRRGGKTHVSLVGHRKGRTVLVDHGRMKQRHWSRRGWRGIGLKLGHRLAGPPGFDKGAIAAKAKRGKHLGQSKDHDNKGKHLGQNKDHNNKGKHLGQNKDHDNKGKHLGQNKDHDNKGKHLGQNKDHDNKGKHLGQSKAAGSPAAGKKK